ncbi:hypothetical protein AVU12_gp035 [Pseudomonas phage KPP21]|uniref:Uncharacterized protein n=1 Tax=Pseudomonas phage KPP21 TaxID=1678082 RepID=A0A0H5BI67_BPK21|nr:hypothetical protein AVU12_gp035 [Pseudomonas phage KPP21]BAR94594.1 hypothetical protein [Pseudomonas phage KPP21]
MKPEPAVYECIYTLVLSDKYYKEHQLSVANKLFKDGSQVMDHLNAVGTHYLQWTQVWEAVETLI